jgi:flagellar basal body-associated protein FliL
MADQEDAQNEQNNEQETKKTKTSKGKMLPWLITVVAIAVCASAGFFIGRLFGTRGSTQTVAAAEQDNPGQSGMAPPLVDGPSDGKSWYYDLESVVANLNEPGVSRYVRVGLTLEVDSSMDEKDGVLFFDERQPLLKHRLMLYLSNLTIEDLRGEENLRHLPTQIADEFNRQLFPNAKPRINHILFKEFSIQ